MSDDWFVPMKIPMSWDHFLKLPRHPAYRYEYRNGELSLTGRPILKNCRIATGGASPNATVTDSLQLLPVTSWEVDVLGMLFQDSFQNSPPYASLTPSEKSLATQEHFLSVLSGHSWPVVWEASRGVRLPGDSSPIGISLITLIPDGDWSDFTDPAWKTPPPEKALESRWGVPHLTWLCVSQNQQRRGLGKILLDHARFTLMEFGYSELTSTILVGDHVSTFWHWKQGFQLLS